MKKNPKKVPKIEKYRSSSRKYLQLNISKSKTNLTINKSIRNLINLIRY